MVLSMAGQADAPERGELSRLGVFRRIHVRLTAIYALALLLVLTPAAVFIYRSNVAAELEGLYSRLRMTTVSLAAVIDARRLAAITEAGDPYRLELEQRFRAVMAEAPEISSLYVFRPTADPNVLTFVIDTDVRKAPAAFGQAYDARNYPELVTSIARPMVEREPVADAWGLSISGFAPVRDAAGEAIAIVGIDTDAARVELMERRLLFAAIGISVGAMLLLGLVAVGVGRALRGPLAKVIAGTERIAGGELSARVALDRRDEFGVLGRHFDRMAVGLEEREQIRAMFGRYVSEDVAKKLLNDRANAVLGEEREVSVLFSDLRGYSTLSEGLLPADVLALMNRYLERMSPAIAVHGGCVIEYQGDGILAVFNAPDDVADHAEHATRCALAMRDALAGLNAEWDAAGTSASWRARGVDGLRARIGVHTGRVVAGTLGSDLRMKYAVLGDTVNLAARLEGLNEALGSDILISAETFARLPAELAARFVARGEQLVKGRSRPVAVYSA